MVLIEDLKKIRNEAAEKLKVEAEKRQLKNDIKKIKAATLRAKLGFTKDRLLKKPTSKTSGSIGKPSLLKKGGKALFDGFMAMGKAQYDSLEAQKKNNLPQKGGGKRKNRPVKGGFNDSPFINNNPFENMEV